MRNEWGTALSWHVVYGLNPAKNGAASLGPLGESREGGALGWVCAVMWGAPGVALLPEAGNGFTLGELEGVSDISVPARSRAKAGLEVLDLDITILTG